MDHSRPTSLLVFFIANYFLTFLIVSLVDAGISLIDKPKPLTINTVAEALFSYYLLFTIGVNNLVNFVFHVFFGDIAAKFIGWENSPFQAEVGFASLGVGIAAVIAFKASLPFRFATLIPPSAFSLGAAGGHILSDDRGEELFTGQRGRGSPNRHSHSNYRIRVFVALLQTSEIGNS